MTARQGIEAQALDWAVRTADPEFDQWEDFTRWLEADPAHAPAYDRIAMAVGDVAGPDLPASETLEAPENVVPLAPRRFSRRWLGGALAACAAMALAVGYWQLSPGGTVYETRAGEQRQIALADGSSVRLGGASRLVVLDGEGRAARLESGEALFEVRHNEAAPFTLAVGDDTLVDIGTLFNVRRRADETTLAVAEGAVMFNPRAEGLRVDPGQRLVSHDKTGKVVLDAIPADQVGEWSKGRLTFRGAGLDEIAEDLSRASGLRFVAGDGAEGLRASGSVLIDPIRKDPASLAPLLGVSVRRQGEGWVIGG